MIMNKIYTFLALAATASLTCAASVPEITAKSIDFQAKLRVATPAPQVNKVLATADHSNDTWNLLGDGIYVASVLAEVYGGATETPVKVYESNESPGVYKAVGVWADMLGVQTHELIVDASDPSFVIVPKQDTGLLDNVDKETYIASWTYVFTEEMGYPASVVQQAVPDYIPTLTDKVVTFPAGSLALQWPNAPEDSKYETDPTEWYEGSTAGALVLPGGTYVSEWQLLGEGTVSGDMLFTLFGATPAEYQANIYMNNKTEGLYKVEQAIQGLYDALQFNSAAPDITFDATDPENVSLPLCKTGIGSASAGSYYLGSYSEVVADDAASCPDDYKIRLVEDETHLTFECPATSLVIYATAGQLYPGNSQPVTISVKKQSGVTALAPAVSNDAAVEYFNLQGQAIKNPASGSLVIRRQGTNVTKVIVP